MFLLGVGEALRLKRAQGTDDTETGVARLDHVVDVTELGSLVRVGELLGIFIHLLGNELGTLFGVLDFGNLLAIEHLDSTAGTHHGDLGGRPSVVDVVAQLLAAHHEVRATV